MMAVRAHGGIILNPASLAGLGGVAPRPPVIVEAYDAGRFKEWNNAVSRVKNAGFFHHSSWMEVLDASYGFKPTGLIFRREGTPLGLLPLVEVVSRFTGRRGVSLPFADECPLLVPADTRPDNLLPAMVDFARSRRWDFFEVRGSNESFRPDVPSVRFHGHSIQLPSDPAELWTRLKGPVRTAIRKAEAAGVVVEFSSSVGGLREFHQLYRRTRQRHGLPPQPFSFFEAVHDRVLARGDGMVVLARKADQCVAGAVFFRQGNRALFKYGAFDTRYQELRANNLVFWAALKRSIELECTAMDMGRTSIGNEGLRRFKQGWASAEYAIEYSKYELKENRFVVETDRSAGWYNWAFRVAPRWVSATVGKVLYKHWA